MKNLKKSLILHQMEACIRSHSDGTPQPAPKSGWIQSVRLAMGMSLRQLAERLNVSTSALSQFEKREQADAITLGTLKKAAEAMNMEMVYYFKPKQSSIQQTIERQARRKANEIIDQSNQTMRLEDQETSASAQALERERLTQEIMNKMPITLWD